MPVDTDTRLPRPAELIGEAFAGLDDSAALPSEDPTLEVEDARPLVKPEYRGRHRTAGPSRQDPWNRDPAWFPGEKTRDLASARQQVVGVPLPPRDLGASDLVAPAEPVKRLDVLGGLLRALRRGAR